MQSLADLGLSFFMGPKVPGDILNVYSGEKHSSWCKPISSDGCQTTLWRGSWTVSPGSSWSARGSFVHESKRLFRKYEESLPLCLSDMLELWADIKVFTSVPYVIPGEVQDNKVKQSLALVMIAQKYPQETWIHVYTNGSATIMLWPTGRGKGGGGGRALASSYNFLVDRQHQ